MSTWRVPEAIKEEISKLVPSVYATTSEAVIELCRLGLQQLSEYPVSDATLTRKLFAEEFYIKLESSALLPTGMSPGSHACWVLPLDGYPLGTLKLQSIRYVGPTTTDIEHCTARLQVDQKEILKTGIPFSWLIPEYDLQEMNCLRIKQETLYVMVTAHNGYLPPRGSMYLRCKRAL